MCLSKTISIQLLLILFLLIPKPSHSEWLEFSAGCPEGSEPVTGHNITLDEFIGFDVELRGLQADTVEHDGIDYLRFTGTPGTSPMGEVGYPELPVVTCFVAVPDESDLTLCYSTNLMSKINCLPVYPAPLDSLVVDSLNTPHIEEFFRKDSSAYASTEWYPEVQAVLSGEFRLRDQRVAIVDVYPVQYLASEDSLRVWSDIELYTNFEGADPAWNDAGLGYYDRLIGDRLIGYTPSYTYTEPGAGDVFRHENLSNPPPFIPDYVIIVADGLDGEWIDYFAEYRAELNGFDVLIANVDDILDQLGGSPPYPTPDLIRDYTELLWDWSNPGHRPTYLLLIGDHEDASSTTYPSWLLPTFQFEGYDPVHLSGNDEWYACFGDPREGNGFPDMMVGRLPAREADNLQNMLDLIVEYESEDELPGPSYRRYITRLAGTEFGGSDRWSPSPEWTDALRQWLGYEWDSYYCGDGENTWNVRPPNPDGSKMTSADWVQACETVFERGSQILFYTDHGGVHYFECAMNEDIPGYFGRPDSTFDDLDVRALSHGEDHWYPFVLLYSCSQGTYNWTYDEQYTSYYSLWNCYSDDPFYDFGVDCFAEELMKNTNGGGVFAASWAASVGLGECFKNTIIQPFYYGITRTGDMIQTGRLFSLNTLVTGGTWKHEIGLFNLLGDPAVDIGDRVSSVTAATL